MNLRLTFILLSAFYFLLSTQVKSQNADCANWLEIDTFYHAKSVNGFGKLKEFDSRNLADKTTLPEEKYAMWYTFSANHTGVLTIDIMADNHADDWDFMLYKHEANFCERFAQGKVKPIRGNISRSHSTGLLYSDQAKNFVGAGLQSNSSKYLNVEKGETFVLVVNNAKDNVGGHRVLINSRPIVEEVVEATVLEVAEKDPNLKELVISILDKETGKKVPSKIHIEGLTEKTITLNDVTNYQTELPKINIRANAITFANGYMIASDNIKLSKNRSKEKYEVQLEKIAPGKKVNLSKIQFVGNQAAFLPGSQKSLEMLLAFMQVNETTKIEVEGHVNGPNQPNTNDYKLLSLNRAIAVKDYLIENGVEKERIEFKGYGNSQMLFPNPMKEAEHAANRRVEIKIIKP